MGCPIVYHICLSWGVQFYHGLLWGIFVGSGLVGVWAVLYFLLIRFVVVLSLLAPSFFFCIMECNVGFVALVSLLVLPICTVFVSFGLRIVLAIFVSGTFLFSSFDDAVLCFCCFSWWRFYLLLLRLASFCRFAAARVPERIALVGRYSVLCCFVVSFSFP